MGSKKKGAVSLRYFSSSLILVFIIFGMFSHQEAKAVTQKKVGVIYSKISEEYANTIRPGGTYKGQTVVAKEDFSSIKDKRLKTKILLERNGFTVEYINDQQLTNLEVLQKYDTIVFPNTVLMSKEQRYAVKEYIKQGGGAIFAYATARNESAYFPKEGQMDISALIYHTDTWIYEWDNLSEVFQAGFVNDVVLKNYQIASVGQHPIIKNTLGKLGKKELNIKHNNPVGEWIEVIKQYPNMQITPLLEYTNYGYNSSPIHTPTHTGAAYAVEYGQGKMVFFGFQLLNFIEANGPEAWEDRQAGLAWDKLIGGGDLEALFVESVRWVDQKHNISHVVDRTVDMELTDVKAYSRANDYVFYGTMTAKSIGNMINRGTMRVEVVSPNGVVLNSYEKYVVGLTPKGTSYPEKIQLTIPKKPTNGAYYLRTFFRSEPINKKNGAKIAGDIDVIHIQNNVTKGIAPLAFKDVPNNFWAAKDIYSLAGAGIVQNSNGSSFQPNAPITRLDAATMIVNSLGLSVKNRPNPKMKDIKSGQQGFDVIATVIDEGIFSGSNGQFNPNAYLTREQMAKILVNAFKLRGSTENRFQDVEQGAWSEPFIKILVFNNITTVKEHFRPVEKTTRAQFASFLRRSATAYEQP